jgi:hypothetical protein
MGRVVGRQEKWSAGKGRRGKKQFSFICQSKVIQGEEEVSR